MSSLNFEHELNLHTSSHNSNLLDPEEFRRQGHMIIDFLADYYADIEKYPVLSQVEPGYLHKRLPKSTPHDPEPIKTILQDVQDHIVPGITHWQSPNFFAYFQCTSSIAGFLGEMLCTGFNVVGFNWIASPVATELETIVMDWLGEMLNLPKSFLFSGNGGGVIQGTTCEAILCTLVAARDQMLCRIGRENAGKLVVYGSDQTHSALQKADSLRSTICADIEAGLVPLYLCANVGTTSTTAIDPLGSLCDVAKDYGLWVHVDAAYAGSACICPEFRQFMDGIEAANSLSLNAHKWLFTPLDCCCLWVKDPSALIKSLSTNPEFLRNKASDSKQVVDYKDWQITLSRRFRALKLWFVLRSYGVANLKNFMRSHVEMAKLFEGLVAMDKRFEIVVPRNFAMICFRVLPSAMGREAYQNCKVVDNGQKLLKEEITTANELNQKLLESMNASGRVYMTHTVLEDMYVIRFAVGASRVEERHVIMAWKVVQEHVTAILSNN
ncbi:phenylacetaldehyde synthase-like [Juglans microcarpa x Juglans regia]|uniref:phenylacetaldehyde synthase-like n=1 Tax=Juglans microcarpa x Juglans regia TaxID=2249226 RepID=UPI001B7D9CA3|nr:phenylacetaldehyde synthase-like [Juglans microcarpa x Juglans regia]